MPLSRRNFIIGGVQILALYASPIYADESVMNLKQERLKKISDSKAYSMLYFNGDRSKKKMALTFDDGPSNSTKEVIGTLRKYHANGTFFIVGEMIFGNEDVVKSMIEYGFEIGNHSYDHPDLRKLKSKESVGQQIKKTDEKLESLGIQTKLFRPPYGSFDKNVLAVTKNMGKKVVLWDIDSGDWRRPGIDKVAEYVLNNSENGSIIGLHDHNARNKREKSDLVKILDKIVPELQNRGNSLVTVSELLNFDD